MVSMSGSGIESRSRLVMEASSGLGMGSRSGIK